METKKRALIKTSGISKTKQDARKMPQGIKIPIYGYRGYRDPKTKDLVDIENAIDDAIEQVAEVNERAKKEISDKKARKAEEEKEKLRQQLKKELEEKSEQ